MSLRTFDLIAYSVALLSAPWFLSLSFYSSHRARNAWIRWVCLILAVVGIAFGVIGIVLLAWGSQLSRSTRILLYHIEYRLPPFAIGLLVSLLLSSEFRQIARRHRLTDWFDATFKV